MASFSCHFLARKPDAFDGAILCQRITVLESHSAWPSRSSESSHGMAYPGQILKRRSALGTHSCQVLSLFVSCAIGSGRLSEHGCGLPYLVLVEKVSQASN